MELGEKDKFGLENDVENHLSFHKSGISSTDWQMGLLPATNISMASCQGTQMVSSQCPPGSIVNSFCPTIWDNSSNSQSLNFPGTCTSTSNVPIVKPVSGMSWSPTDQMPKVSGGYPQTGIGILPPGLSQLPADSAFVERAVRFSCFGNGNLTSTMSLFKSPNAFVSTPRGPGVGGATQAQKNDPNLGESSKDLAGIRAGGQGSNAGSPVNPQKDTGNSHGIVERGDLEISGSGQEDAPSFKGLAAKKRKRNSQEMEIDQAKEEPGQPNDASKENNDAQQKDEQNNSSVGAMKKSGKQAKDGSEPPKEDYIHVRARRGQATNSHSLAERVRREKISERMKFLQGLVPGCSKVTGKAVMLDEIINYVQSLQRQVEFLSMKLAAVNPQLDFNIEGLLSKDIFQPRASSSSAIGFSPDLPHPFLHPSSQGLAQPGMSGVTPPDLFRRAVNAQLTSMNPYSKHQMVNSWDDELHNVLSQMGFGNNIPLNMQESNDKSHESFN